MKSIKKISDSSEIVEQEYDVVYSNVTDNSVILSEGKEQPKYDYVDLGLPSGTLWATVNIGANAPEEAGKYFQWGDPVGYEGDEALAHSTWATAPFNGGNTSYNNAYWQSVSGNVLTEDTKNLKAEYDAAHVNWGGDWKMPTYAQLLELEQYTKYKWETLNGIYGQRITSTANTSNSIFIPAHGRAENGSIAYDIDNGWIWGSTFNITNIAYGMQVYHAMPLAGQFNRAMGHNIRPVMDKKS